MSSIDWSMIKLWMRVKWHSFKTIARDYIHFFFMAGFVVSCVCIWVVFFLTVIGVLFE